MKAHYDVATAARLLAAALVITAAASDASAALLNFDLDSSQSSITLGGSFMAIDLEEQGPGSTAANYSGTISVDVDDLFSPTTIQIMGSSAVASITGQWLPEAGGGPAAGDPGVAQDANYGLQLDAGVLGTAFAAVRNVEFNVTSGVEPVVGGEFASTQSLNVVSGLFAVNAPPAFGIPPSEDDLSGDVLVNASASQSMYSVSGLTATLTIPIDIVDADDLTVTYSGQLVATAVIPEPASLTLLAIAMAGVLGTGFVRRR